MWWLIIPVGIGAIKLIYNVVTNQEREARENWANTRDQVEKSIEEHRKNIENHLAEAKTSYDFHFLCNLHFSSMKVADVAYSLLNDASTSLTAITKMIVKAKEQRALLQDQLEIAKKEKNNTVKADLTEQLKQIKDMRKALFDDQDRIKIDKETLLKEVKRLNMRTSELKYYIKVRCGIKGLDWYTRLENRKLLRNKE